MAAQMNYSRMSPRATASNVQLHHGRAILQRRESPSPPPPVVEEVLRVDQQHKRPADGHLQSSRYKRSQIDLLPVPVPVPAPFPAPTPPELMRTGVFLTVATGSMLVAQFQPDCTATYWKSFRKASAKDGSQFMFCTGAYDAIKERVRENPDYTTRDMHAVINRIGCASRVTAFHGAFMAAGDGIGDPSYIFDKGVTKCSPDCVWNRFTVKGDPDKDFVDETASRLLLQSQLFMSNGTMAKKKHPIDSWKNLYHEYVEMCKQYTENTPGLNVIRTLINKLPDLEQLGMHENLDQYWAFIEYISTSAYDSYLVDDVYMTDIVKRGIKGLENQMRIVQSWTS